MEKNKVYKLKNTIKHYEWGSLTMIPEFLNIINSEETPFAEMWMGTHSGGHSYAEDTPLEKISGKLPYLFKLLAVEKPLSIQAHPDKEKAMEGFRLEEEAGIDIRSPVRKYKDPNSKPEMLCAISEFSFMAGFRSKEEIKNILDEFVALLPQLKEILSPLYRSLNTDTLAVFFRILFNLSKLEKEYICELINKTEFSRQGDLLLPELWALMKKFASIYPEDPAILSPLYLNYMTIQPGEAVYIPAKVLHAYTSGFGVELMLSSDNVLRGGLTPKYIDIPELMSVLDFNPHKPKIFTPSSSSWFVYETDDFSLATMKGDGTEVVLPVKKSAIGLVTDGEVIAEEISFFKGDSFFINEDCKIKGNFSAFFAY